MVEEQDLIGQAPRLAQIMGGHHDLGAGTMDRLYQLFDGAGGRGIQARRRLVEEQHLRLQRPGARQGQALLLAAGEHAGRLMRERAEAGAPQDLGDPLPPLASAEPPQLEGEADISGCRAAQHDRALKDHGLAPAQRRARAAAPADAPGGGLDQAMAEPQQQALSRAIGAEDDGARAGRELDIDLGDPHLAARGIAHAFQAERQDGGAVALLPRAVMGGVPSDRG